jgi:hypothetical protein
VEKKVESLLSAKKQNKKKTQQKQKQHQQQKPHGADKKKRKMFTCTNHAGIRGHRLAHRR